jgi:hypothetical protein
MSTPHQDERPADDLQEVVDVLRERRPTLDPLALDAIKLRAMSRARRSTASREKGFFMRSRLTTLLTIAFLSLGTGGAVACVSWVEGDGFGFGFAGHDGGSASCTQYRPGNGFGDKHHCHTGPPGHDGEGGGNSGGGNGGGGGGGGGDQGAGGIGGSGDHGHGHH